MLSSDQSAGNLMRLAPIGPTPNGMYPIVGLAARDHGLKDIGVAIDPGAGIDIALEILAVD